MFSPVAKDGLLRVAGKLDGEADRLELVAGYAPTPELKRVAQHHSLIYSTTAWAMLECVECGHAGPLDELASVVREWLLGRQVGVVDVKLGESLNPQAN